MYTSISPCVSLFGGLYSNRDGHEKTVSNGFNHRLPMRCFEGSCFRQFGRVEGKPPFFGCENLGIFSSVAHAAYKAFFVLSRARSFMLEVVWGLEFSRKKTECSMSVPFSFAYGSAQFQEGVVKRVAFGDEKAEREGRG